MKIQGRELTESDKWSQVTYVPRHAHGNASHRDCETGVLKSWNDATIFVIFSKSRNVQGCDSADLVWG